MFYSPGIHSFEYILNTFFKMFFVLLALCIYADYFSIYRIRVSLKFTKCTHLVDLLTSC